MGGFLFMFTTIGIDEDTLNVRMWCARMMIFSTIALCTHGLIFSEAAATVLYVSFFLWPHLHVQVSEQCSRSQSTLK